MSNATLRDRTPSAELWEHLGIEGISRGGRSALLLANVTSGTILLVAEGVAELFFHEVAITVVMLQF